MLAELEIIPIGTKSASLSGLLAEVAKLIDASGLDYRVGPMGTVVEGEWDQIMSRYGIVILLLMILPIQGTSPIISLISPLVSLILSLLLPGTQLL